jgi:hypothetical protein
MITRTSGIEGDGSCVNWVVGTTTIRTLKASYGDMVEKGAVQEMATQFIGAVTPGTYKPEMMKITLRNSVWRAEFLPKLPFMGSANSPIVGIVQYTIPGVGIDSDMMSPCYYVGSSLSPDSSNKGIEVDLTFYVQQYYWTEARSTKNSIAGGMAIGQNRL